MSEHSGDTGPRVSDADLLHVYERAPIGIAVVDFEGRFLRVNPWYAGITGHASAALTAGMKFQEITHPDDVAEDVLQFERMKSGEISSYEMEKRFTRPDGSVMWGYLRSSLVPMSTGESACVRIVADITARKTAENLLRQSEGLNAAMLESALDCIIAMDGAGLVMDFNPAAERTFGYTAQEVVGRPLADAIIPERFRDAHWRGLRRFFETGEGPLLGRRVEVEAMRKDGSEFPAELAISVTRVEKTAFFTAYLRDISERKHWEATVRRSAEVLEQKARELERSNADLESFATVIAHDLKEPLRGISTGVDLLVQDLGEIGPEPAARVESIKRLARRMYGLMDALMELSRVGREEIRKVPTDIGMLVSEAAEQIEQVRAQAGASVVRRPDLPVLECAPDLIRQVLANLMANAIKYNRSPTPTVEIGGFDTGGERGVFVRDNGIGIDPRHHESIFRMFKRLHGGDSFGGGLGVGLALSRRIIQRHEGRMWVVSTPGAGATFYFTTGR